MNTLPFNILETTARTTSLLFSGMLALGLVACGSSAAPNEPSGETEQPITAGDTEDDAPASNTDACALGTPIDGPFGEDCYVTAKGRCFTTDEAACACAGCARESCLLAESSPAQAFCQDGDSDSDPDGDSDGNVSDGPHGGGSSPGYPGSGTPSCDPGQTDPAPPIPANCDFVVDGACFDDGAEACQAAGCAENDCIILESYPAQVGCGN